MADYGVTDTGFVAKPLEVILAEMEADLKATISSTIKLDTTSPNGQILGTIAGQVAKVWEVNEDVYHAGLTSASGYSLDNVAALTGTKRDGGTPSVVPVVLNLDAGTTVPIDSRIQVEDDPNAVFLLRTAVTNPGAVAADINAEAYAQEVGPTVANAGTLTVILDAATGWNTVTNPEDATLGALKDSDPQLRLRREQELARSGNQTVDAIRVAVLDVAEVTSVQVLENDSDVVVDTIPPGHIEVIVLGGSGPDIAQAIFDSKPPGTGTAGSDSEPVYDAQGIAHLIKYTRPTEIDIYIDVTIAGENELTYVGDDAVEAALIAYMEGKPPGVNVIPARLASVVYGLGGIVDAPEAVVTVLVGTTVSTSGATISIGPREIADFDTSRITVS